MGEPIQTSIGAITAEHFRPGRVRHQVIVGPKFLYSLFDPEDEMHAVSRAFMMFVRNEELPYRYLIVNDHIIDEAATRLKKRVSIQMVSTFLTTLDKSHLYRFEYVPKDVFEEATDTFTEWTDLNASFTDFVVVQHMDELDIDHIVTYDRHYECFDVTTFPYREEK